MCHILFEIQRISSSSTELSIKSLRLTVDQIFKLKICNLSYSILQKEKEKKSPLSWSKCMWKIRKTICIHFLLLIVDLPAIPLCIFLLMTGLRTSRLISDLVGGQFYMLFAVSVYYHALHFLVDVFFIILFLVLCILRPKQVLRHLILLFLFFQVLKEIIQRHSKHNYCKKKFDKASSNVFNGSLFHFSLNLGAIFVYAFNKLVC